jgi:transcriptional regulator with XRE-family HTH domain
MHFLRKAIEWTAQESAEKLGVRPETISRWESGKEPIGPANEKLLRLIVGQELGAKAPLVNFDDKAIIKMKIKAFRNRPLAMFFEQVQNEEHKEVWKQKAA